VVICSDFPTQIAIASTFGALGFAPYGPGGQLQVNFVVALSLLDTAALVALVLMFLYAHGEHPRDVFLGPRRVTTEIAFGIPLIAIAVGIGLIVLVVIMKVAPSLHTVANNPLQELLRSPRDAALFAVVVVIAGGVREEIQRAFLLRRFEQSLGGGAVGVVSTSIAFGAGHLLQGVDAAIATGVLGAFWGLAYLTRRSVIAPMVSHSGFDLLQIVQFITLGR
jgi:membrane protease YdiL (CAAX protease family)